MMSAGGKRGQQLTERSLVVGRSGGPGVRIRQAGPDDLDAVRQLVPLAGTKLDEQVAAAVADGIAGVALQAGLRDGSDGFTWHMAEQFVAHQNDNQLIAYLSAALVLVAEHHEHGISGALIAFPPPNVVTDVLDQTQAEITDPRKRGMLVLAGGLGLTKIQAVAVAEEARGLRIGGSMLTFCANIYFHCGYKFVYGQMPGTPGLETFYRRYGFDVPESVKSNETSGCLRGLW